MWNRIKTYFTENDPRRAVHFLSAGFALLFAAFIGLGIIHVHEAKQEREQNAHLLAADLLRMRDLVGNDAYEDVYGELIRWRIGEVLTERDSRYFTEALRGDRGTPLLNRVSEGIEDMLEAGEMSATRLRRILEDALTEMRAETPLTMASDTVSVTVPSISALPRVNPVEVAERFFGVQNLFRGTTPADTAVTVAYCDNVYAVFHQRTGKMSAYVAECNPGAPVFTDGECVQAAVEYASKRQGLQVITPGEAIASGGIYFVRLRCRGDNDALIGVRQDTGRICLFLRTSGK